MWNEIFGPTPASQWAHQAATAVSSAGSAAQQAATTVSAAHSAAQQASIYNYNLYGAKINDWAPSQWVWNGRPCTIEEFAERCYGDTPERTYFLLKYKGIDK